MQCRKHAEAEHDLQHVLPAATAAGMVTALDT